MRLVAAISLILFATAAGAFPPNPKDPFGAAMKENIYRTPNWFVGAYHYIQCWANSIIEPANTQEVASAVTFYYNKTKAGTPVTFRTSRPMFHSSTKFPCSSSPLYHDDLYPQNSSHPIQVGLLQTKLNKVLDKDYRKWTMRVQPGIRYTELLKEAQKAGMSIQVGTPTAYAGLTLAGILATTSHGSGDRTTSAVWDTLIEITWVDGTGKVHVSKPEDPDFRGMVGGIGVYGIMTEFLMQMTPPSYTTLITVRKNDTNMIQEIENLLKITPHILIFWRPDISSFKAYMLKPADKGAKIEANATATLLPSIAGREKGAKAFALMSSSLKDDSDALKFLCPLQTEASLSSSWASVNGQGKWNVTGPTNNMQASECDDHCNWNDNEVFYGTAQDVEFTAEFDQLESWIADVKKVFKEDLFEDGKTKYRCMGPGYLWIRFGAGYDGYTATNAGLKRPVFLQSTWLRSRAVQTYPMRYQFVVDLLEQLTLCKYKARPHWGKNHERTFTYPKCSVRPMYPKFHELLKLQAAHDPAKMFEPRLFKKVANNESFVLSPRCTLWQHCYCEADIHCAVGFKCVPSIAFPEYKVCKAPMKNEPGSLLPKIFATMADN